MKKTLMLLVFLTTSAFAQIEYNTETIFFRDQVSINDLSCVAPVLAGQFYTQLEHTFSNPAIEMSHGEAQALDCDNTALTAIINSSRMHFGFVHPTITVIKRTAVSPHLINGQCVRNFDEQLEVNFGQGTVLKTSKEKKLKAATGCIL